MKSIQLSSLLTLHSDKNLTSYRLNVLTSFKTNLHPFNFSTIQLSSLFTLHSDKNLTSYRLNVLTSFKTNLHPFNFSTIQLSSLFTLHSDKNLTSYRLNVLTSFKTNLHPFNSLHASHLTPHSDKNLSPLLAKFTIWSYTCRGLFTIKKHLQFQYNKTCLRQGVILC